MEENKVDEISKELADLRTNANRKNQKIKELINSIHQKLVTKMQKEKLGIFQKKPKKK